MNIRCDCSDCGKKSDRGFRPHPQGNLLWVRSFRTVEERRLALPAFKETYNHHWRIGRHGSRSPIQVMENRKRGRQGGVNFRAKLSKKS
jgi:hypothetical protein